MEKPVDEGLKKVFCWHDEWKWIKKLYRITTRTTSYDVSPNNVSKKYDVSPNDVSNKRLANLRTVFN